MVIIEEKSSYMLRKHNEQLIKDIINEKFKLGSCKQMYPMITWKANIYKLKWGILPVEIGFVYPSEDHLFSQVVIGGDPDLFKETADKLEKNGIGVTIQKPF